MNVAPWKLENASWLLHWKGENVGMLSTCFSISGILLSVVILLINVVVVFFIFFSVIFIIIHVVTVLVRLIIVIITVLLHTGCLTHKLHQMLLGILMMTVIMIVMIVMVTLMRRWLKAGIRKELGSG